MLHGRGNEGPVKHEYRRRYERIRPMMIRNAVTLPSHCHNSPRIGDGETESRSHRHTKIKITGRLLRLATRLLFLRVSPFMLSKLALLIIQKLISETICIQPYISVHSKAAVVTLLSSPTVQLEAEGSSKPRAYLDLGEYLWCRDGLILRFSQRLLTHVGQTFQRRHICPD